jgi:hypothetical protein
LESIYKPVEHMASPVRVRPSPQRTGARGSESAGADDILLPQPLLPSPQRTGARDGSESADDILLPPSLLQSPQSESQDTLERNSQPKKRVVSTIVPMLPAKKSKK